MNQQKGFTLIEVLVAMAITAIAAVIAYSGLDSAIRLAESSEAEVERLQKINRVFDIMSRDFRQITPRKVRNPDGFGFEPPFLLNESSTPMLQFSRNGWTNPQAERFQRSQLQRVTYHYDGEKVTRQSWQMMDRYGDSEPMEVDLLDDVSAFRVRVLVQIAKPGQAAPVAEWLEQWPTLTIGDPAEAGLPMSVELTMELDGWGEIRRVFAVAGSS